MTVRHTTERRKRARDVARNVTRLKCEHLHAQTERLVETLLQLERDVRKQLAHALELQLELGLLKTETSSTSVQTAGTDKRRSSRLTR